MSNNGNNNIENKEEEPFSTYKVVLLGASDVGKSSLVLRFVKGKFFERRENTIGAAFLTKTITIDGKRVKFEIWDTAGQERYHSLAPMYYRDSAGTLIIYDITCKESLNKAKNWLNELYKSGSTTMTIFFVGNKNDLPDRVVESEEAKSFADEQNLTFFETSAKTNCNIDELFETLGRQLLIQHPPSREELEKPTVHLSPSPSRNLNNDNDKCGCQSSFIID